MISSKLISRLGIGTNEAEIYLSLVEKGSGTVSDIATRIGLHRPTVYKHLPNLQEAGLITTTTKGKRTLYVAESPSKLERLLEETSAQLHTLIPELTESFTRSKHKPVVKFYEGKKGIREVFNDLLDTLKRGDVFYRYSSRTEPMSDTYLPKGYRERRDAKQLERFVIASPSHAKKKKPRLERQIKTVPDQFGLFDYGITLFIYADKIAIIDFNTDTAFIVENPALAKFQQTLFRLLYHKL